MSASGRSVLLGKVDYLTAAALDHYLAHLSLVGPRSV
jgi:hypothetical protein